MNRTAARITNVGILLCAITILSWWLGTEGTGAGIEPATVITIAVVAMGLLEARFIIRHFMEVRTGPAWLRTAPICG
ncbi:cytochrome C oxidase subunit IV family protein [Nocardia sp. NBC_00565]|uniref:cytochrome C oxidase subunit IV family protein n=1 Tax=Nocardia sp. NBC_00565 TaxID=2975993 RepID=UPI002E80D5D5|nr:cytochrome C oxidase subunit IV family protein [Nocardia sp. NBC_00565]WUC05849.1 cytochrome C oxidase subunit IV family protein [Nocardia sp. NBC_00565]